MSPRARRWGILGIVLATGVAAWLVAGHLREESEKAAVIGELRARIDARRPANIGDDGGDIPEAENAAPLYVAASDLLEAAMATDLDGVAVLIVEEGAMVPPRGRAFVASNGDACSLLDRAAALPHCGWKDLSPPDHLRFSHLLQMEMVRGSLAREAGDFQGVVSSARRVLLLGMRIPVMVEAFDGLPLHAWHAANNVRELLCSLAADSRLDPAGARAALEVASDLGDPWEFWVAWFHQDHARFEELALRLLGPDREAAYEELGYGESLKKKIYRLLPGSSPGMRSPRGYPSAEEVRRAMAAADAALTALDARDGPAFRPSGPLAALFAGRPGDEWPPTTMVEGITMGERSCAAVAGFGALRGALALRVFSLREGRPAREWEDVVPELLPAVPRDPFTGGQLGMESLPDGHGSVGCRGWGKEVRVRW